jgi:hypothetical protein
VSPRTERLSVLCPYCGTCYTFRSEAKWDAFRNSGKTEPLHKECKIAKAKEATTCPARAFVDAWKKSIDERALRIWRGAIAKMEGR